MGDVRKGEKMTSEETRAKGIYYGGLGLLLFGIGFILYAVGQITLGSIRTVQMGRATWMTVEDHAAVTEESTTTPSIEEVMEFLIDMQKEAEGEIHSVDETQSQCHKF
jgi:hypothetical protein